MASFFKEGDIIRRTGGSDDSVYDMIRGKVYTVSRYEGGNIVVKENDGRWSDSNFELVSSNSSTAPMSLTSEVKALFRKEPEKSLIKAGILNDNEEFTSEGQSVFLSFLLKEHGEKFKTDIVDPLLAEKATRSAK